MSKMVMGLGFMLFLVFFISIYSGYTMLTDAAATLTASVRHAIAGSVMVPANGAAGGGYVNEGLNAQGLTLNLNTLTQAVVAKIPVLWQGSRMTPLSTGAVLWTLPAAVARGYSITGPITINAITETGATPPTLATTVAIPVSVPTLFGTWTGVLHRAITLPLAGQTGPGTFVPYAQMWADLYQSTWQRAVSGTYGGWFSAAAIGPGSSPGANVPNGIWFASNTFTVFHAGPYTVWVAADDAAVLYLDGQLLATPSLNADGGQGITRTVTLTTGTHVLNAEIINNDNGSTTIVPDGSGSPNPSALAVRITNAQGQIVDATQSNHIWTINAYPSAPPVGSTTTGTLP